MSKEFHNNLSTYNPLLVLRGAVITQPVYTEIPQIPQYNNNPLIEALPPILDQNQVAEQLIYLPNYEEDQRNLPAHMRLHLIQSALQLFVPLPIHFDLEQRFSRMLRLGYQGRNPVQRNFNFWNDINERVEDLAKNTLRLRSTTTGFTIVGISGVGKTTSVEAILSLYPQVIAHTCYQGKTFNFMQIVWLKLDCPHDGSIKGLCMNFFQAVDDILGTRYYENYTSGRPTVDELLPHMARVASLHGLGVLVIDEIQHLSQAKSGGASKMLNFFVQLINTIGLPVVLVGTYKAISVLSGEFRQTRRGTGQGDLVWDRMKKDESWDWFLECLWNYQYTREKCPLTPELNQVLYDQSQGITDFAVKLYMLAQIHAITSCEERITPQGISSVAKESLRMAFPILNALRTNNLSALSAVEDVHVLQLDPYFEKAQSELNRKQQIAVLSNTRSAMIKSTSSTTTRETGLATVHKLDSNRKAKRLKTENQLTETLPKIAQLGEKDNLNAYESLKQAGFIRNLLEFLEDRIV